MGFVKPRATGAKFKLEWKVVINRCEMKVDHVGNAAVYFPS